MDIGWPELVIVLVILLLLFGSTKLPKLTRSIGQSAKELRDGFAGKVDEDEKDTKKKS
ncbi:MAG TPA: twin-arginine translocase TatA/TatE family subunit [Candidatus Saccharimonadales bacterium]|nr:twin-arginine translocase TatA/TatE family subunit [Candidatus Saccharimonadales bacterium]